MKISKIDYNRINFDNGSYIECDHEQECCENNYGDFSQVDTIALKTDFDEPLEFEKCNGGFRFGNKPMKMFFVPCYSEQNGYYTSNISIFYNGEEMFDLECYTRINYL